MTTAVASERVSLDIYYIHNVTSLGFFKIVICAQNNDSIPLSYYKARGVSLIFKPSCLTNHLMTVSQLAKIRGYWREYIPTMLLRFLIRVR